MKLLNKLNIQSLLFLININTNKKDKRSLFFLILIMILASFLEMVNIGILVPYINLITNPADFLVNENFQYLFNLFNVDSTNKLILCSSMILIIITFLAAITKLYVLFISNKFIFLISENLNKNIFSNVLRRPYSFHKLTNTSSTIDAITTKNTTITFGAIQQLISLLIAISLIGILTVYLFIFNPLITLMISIILISVYFTLLVFLKRQLSLISITIPKKSTNAIKIVQEGLGNIKDIKIGSLEDYYISRFLVNEHEYKNALRLNVIFSQSPKFVIESVFMVVIVLIIYIISINGLEFITTVPIFAVYILSAQKLLPQFQVVYSSITSLRSSRNAIEEIVKIFSNEIKIDYSNKIITFNASINFKDISFIYENSEKNSLGDINCILYKGSKVGIIGSSGSGKTTFIDILMGLLNPSTGEIIIDDTELNNSNIKSWQSKIAHVPQNVYLSDGDVFENVAFGVENDLVDKDRVKSIMSQIEMHNLIESWPNKYYTKIGERGSKLSGGQIQKFGLARALYKNAELIVLDEATSALDFKSEKIVMDIVNKISDSTTIFIVAHRLTTVKDCDVILKFENGSIIASGSYDEVVKS